MAWPHTVARVIVARKVAKTLTDLDGNPLVVKLHSDLKGLPIARSTPDFIKWLQDSAQAERFMGLIASTVFVVSKRGESRTSLTAPVEWHLLWKISRHDPLVVTLLEYESLSAAQERAYIQAAVLRLLCYPLPMRVQAQLGLHCGFFGLPKRAFATLIMGGSEANLHYHLQDASSKRFKSNAPAQSQSQTDTMQPSIETERVQPDERPSTGLAEPPAFSASLANPLGFGDSTADQLDPDAEPEGEALSAGPQPFVAAVGEPMMVIDGEPERPIEVSAPADAEPCCVEPTTPLITNGNGENGLSEHDGLLPTSMDPDDQVICPEDVGGDRSSHEAGVPAPEAESPPPSVTQSDGNGETASKLTGEQPNQTLEPTNSDPPLDEDSGKYHQLTLIAIDSTSMEQMDKSVCTVALQFGTHVARRGCRTRSK